MSGLSLALLGAFQAEFNEVRLSHFRTKTVQALLVYLTCQPETHNREHLMAVLWPNLPQTSAAQNLRQSLYLLRQAVPEVEASNGAGPVPFLLADRQTVRVNPDGRYDLDCYTFSELLEGDESGWPEAVELYRGDFLADFYLPDSAPFEEWVLARRGYWRRQVLRTLESLTVQNLDRGNLKLARQYARRQIEIDSLREKAHQQLMTALARDGRRLDALNHYEFFAHLLHDDLAVEPSAETSALYEEIRAGDVEAVMSREKDAVVVAQAGSQMLIETLPNNLPRQPAPLIGREAELARLEQFISNPDIRLVSIVAPGGMGKTRLAIAYAERCLQAGHTGPDRFSDGVFFIDLAPLSDAGQIPLALADALNFPLQGDLPPRQQVLNYLADKRVLLLFDNFEHLLDGVDLVVDLLETAHELKVLVTSRERFGIRFEQLYSIEGLPFPDWEIPEDAEKYAAVQLFLQSARRNQPDFAFRSSDDLTFLTRICKVVDGMPLALELAASWVDVLPLAEIAAELRQGLDLLGADMRDLPERHRSVRAAIDYSWQYLTQQEREIFAGLSVFRGGFTREAAKAVAGADLRQLARLVNKCLLQGGREDGRFQLHELLRQYGKEKLAELGLETTARDRHSEYYCSALQEWQAALNSNQMRQAAAEMEADYRNFTLAWENALVQGHFGRLILAINGLGDYYDVTGRWMTGIAHFQDTARQLEPQAGESLTDVETARLLILLYSWLANLDINARQIWTRFLHVFQGILQPALEILEQPIMSKIDSRAEEAYLRLQLGRVLKYLDGRRAEGENQLLAGLRLYRELKDEIGVSDALYELSFYSQLENLPERAYEQFHESLRALPSTGEPRRQVRLLLGLGYLESSLQMHAEEVDFFERAYESAETVGYLVGMHDALVQACYGANLQGQYELAYNYNEQALALAYQINGPVQVANALAQKASIIASHGQFSNALELHQESMAHLAKFGIAGEVGMEPDEIYLHLGNYEKVELLIRGRADVFSFKGNLVWVYLAEARYMETLSLAREFLKRFRTMTDPRGEMMASTGLAFHRLGRSGESKDALYRSLQFCLDTRRMADLRYLLPILPLVLSESAEPEIKERAVELWAMANSSPFVANSQLFADIVGRSMDEFMPTLPPERVDAAQARGRELDWWQTAESLLDELAELGWGQEAETGQ